MLVIRIWRIYKNKITTFRQRKESIFQGDEIALPGIYYLLFFMIWESEKERENNVREKHISVAFNMHPHQGSNPQPGYLSWLGIEFVTFLHMEPYSNQLSHTSYSLGFSWKKSHMTICFWLSCFLMVFKQPLTNNEFELFIRNYFPYL